MTGIGGGHRDREGQRSNRRDNWQDRNRTSEPQPLQEGSEADEARFAQESSVVSG
jgi:hypothetical protein